MLRCVDGRAASAISFLEAYMLVRVFKLGLLDIVMVDLNADLVTLPSLALGTISPPVRGWT